MRRSRPRFRPRSENGRGAGVTLYLAVTLILDRLHAHGFFTEPLFLKASLYALVISIISGLAVWPGGYKE